MNYNNSLRSKTAEPSAMSVPPRMLRGSGQVFRNHFLSSKSLLELLYSSIVSAIGNVVDFMVCTSELVSIEFAQGACQPDKPVCHLLQGGTGKVGKHLHVVLDGV